MVKAQGDEDFPRHKGIERLARHAPHHFAEQDRVQIAVDDPGAGRDSGGLAQYARHERRAVADRIELRVGEVGPEP